MEPSEEFPECTVCRIVRDAESPAYRRITPDDADAHVWFCLTCDVSGLEFSMKFAAMIQEILGDDFGWDDFVTQWADDLDPMKE